MCVLLIVDVREYVAIPYDPLAATQYQLQLALLSGRHQMCPTFYSQSQLSQENKKNGC